MINRFTGPNRWLSNFYPSQIEVDGITYPTVEHAFQAAKTFDMDVRRMISQVSAPSAAKTIGRTVVLREDWEQNKIDVMRDLLRLKFSQQFSRCFWSAPMTPI